MFGGESLKKSLLPKWIIFQHFSHFMFELIEDKIQQSASLKLGLFMILKIR